MAEPTQNTSWHVFVFSCLCERHRRQGDKECSQQLAYSSDATMARAGSTIWVPHDGGPTTAAMAAAFWGLHLQEVGVWSQKPNGPQLGCGHAGRYLAMSISRGPRQGCGNGAVGGGPGHSSPHLSQHDMPAPGLSNKLGQSHGPSFSAVCPGRQQEGAAKCSSLNSNRHLHRMSAWRWVTEPLYQNTSSSFLSHKAYPSPKCRPDWSAGFVIWDVVVCRWDAMTTFPESLASQSPNFYPGVQRHHY